MASRAASSGRCCVLAELEKRKRRHRLTFKREIKLSQASTIYFRFILPHIRLGIRGRSDLEGAVWMIEMLGHILVLESANEENILKLLSTLTFQQLKTFWKFEFTSFLFMPLLLNSRKNDSRFQNHHQYPVDSDYNNPVPATVDA